MVTLLIALLAPAEGQALFDWGARGPVVVAETPAEASTEARVTEVHAALDADSLALRFTFDRPVREAIQLPDGTPVSGRLRAVLYLDADDDRSTGLDSGSGDLRTGADLRLEIGVVSVAADAEEKRAATAVVTAALYSLSPDGRRRTLWRGDDDATPASVSAHGESVEVRLSRDQVTAAPKARLILAQGDRTWVGRLGR